MNSTVTVTVAQIRAAFPTDAGKHLAAALGTSVRTGRWIAATGRVPRKWRPLLPWLLDAVIANRQAALEKKRRELRELLDALDGEAPTPEIARLLDRARVLAGGLAGEAAGAAGAAEARAADGAAGGCG